MGIFGLEGSHIQFPFPMLTYERFCCIFFFFLWCRGMDVVDASRCFNCGSYNHSMKECPKPRDNTAVNNARKHHKSRRNQNASSRNPTRYYQNTPRGKYDGLRPGVLDAETRQLLGLGVRELLLLYGRRHIYSFYLLYNACIVYNLLTLFLQCCSLE